MAHICFITGLYNRYDPLIFHRQGKGLIALGHKVSIVVCDELEDEVIDDIHIYSTRYSPHGRFSRLFLTKRKILEIVKKIDADIYQLQDPEHISLVRFFKSYGKCVFFNMREYYPDMILHKSYIPLFARRIISCLFILFLRKYLKLYDAVFTVTPEFVEILRNNYRLDNTFLLTNFPIPDYNYHLSKEDYLSRTDTVIYEGTIYEESRQNIFLDALQKFPKLHYLLVGKFVNGDNVMKHEYWSHVEFIDGFNAIDLKKYFKRATISNTLRDFGKWDGSYGVIKIFESMEAGIPVILSDVPLYRMMVNKYHCGVLADPNDVSSISKALNFLINNKEEAYEMGQNGRKAVMEEFNWWKQMDIYNSIIKIKLNETKRSCN